MTPKSHIHPIFLLLGAVCTLVGLVELSRLVVLYCLSAGWEMRFCLELATYATGAVWVLHQFYRGVKNRI